MYAHIATPAPAASTTARMTASLMRAPPETISPCMESRMPFVKASPGKSGIMIDQTIRLMLPRPTRETASIVSAAAMKPPTRQLSGSPS